MKKNLIMSLVVSALSLHSATAAQAPGTLEFIGTVTNPSCYVQFDHLTIDMGMVAGASFSGIGSVADPRLFDILLVNCPITVDQASVTFIGVSANASNTILALDDSPNSAKGIGIEILTANDNQPITFDQPTPKQSLTPGNNILPFIARFVAITNTVVGGSVHATAMFSVTYN